VPDYDAFGREINDDPLAALRASTVEPAPAPATPAPAADAVMTAAAAEAPEPAAFEPAAPALPQFVRPPRRARRGLAGLLVLIAVIGGVVWAGNKAVVTVKDGINDVIGEAESQSPSAEPPTGLENASLIRRANFAEAMATLKKSGLGRPFALRVAADRIDATLIGAGGKLHQVQIDSEGALRELGSNPSSDRAALAYGRIDPAAPEHLVRAAAKRVGVRPQRIDYLVLTAGSPLAWGAYFKGGKIVIGDAHGRPQRVL
jgi:hypothetical protein